MVLLKVLRKTRQQEREVRILMLGLDNAGKTTAVKKFNGEDVNTVSPTMGFEIKSFEFKNYQLNVWDVGGQKTLRAYWRNYFDETDGIIWVVDSADTGRMNDCREELKALLQEQRLAGATLLIFANKQDIKGAKSSVQIQKALDLDSMSDSRHWRVEGCSAMTGSGLLAGIDWLVSDIAARVFLMD